MEKRSLGEVLSIENFVDPLELGKLGYESICSAALKIARDTSLLSLELSVTELTAERPEWLWLFTASWSYLNFRNSTKA